MISIWLYRLLIAALTLGGLQACFALICHVWPQALSGRQRRSIWWFFILASFIIFPVPRQLALPQPAYDIVRFLRIPDPFTFRLTTESFYDSLDRYYATVHSGSLRSEQTLATETRSSIEALLAKEDHVWETWVATLMPVIERLYLLGMILLITVAFFKLFMRFYRGRSELSEDVQKLNVPYVRDAILARKPYYQRRLTQWRDALRFYRRGHLTLLPHADPTSLAELWTRFIKKEIYLPHDPLESEDDPQGWLEKKRVKSPLAESLYQAQHPDVVMSSLRALVRIVHWINPSWILLNRQWCRDQQMHRQEALARRLNPKQTKDKRPLVVLGSNAGLILIAILTTAFLGAQMPLHVTRPIQFVQDQPLQQEGYRVNVGELHPSVVQRSYQHVDRHLLQPGLVKISGMNTGYGRNASILIQQFATPEDDPFARQYGIGFSPSRFSNMRIVDQRVIDDNLHVLCRFETTDDLMRIVLDEEGNRVTSYRMDERRSGIRKAYRILSDGNVLILRWQNVPGDDREEPIRHQKREAYFELLDQRGDRIWQKTATEMGLSMQIQDFSALQYMRRPTLIMPDENGGFYLLEHERWLLYHGSEEEVDEDAGFKTYMKPGTLHHFSQDAEKEASWSLGVDETHLFVPLAGKVLQDKVYLAGYVRYQPPYFAASRRAVDTSDIDRSWSWQHDFRAWQTAHVAAFSADGKSLWRQSFDGALEAEISELIIDEDQLHVFMTERVPMLEEGLQPVYTETMRVSVHALSLTGNKEAIWQAMLPGEHLSSYEFQILLDDQTIHFGPRLAEKINVR